MEIAEYVRLLARRSRVVVAAVGVAAVLATLLFLGRPQCLLALPPTVELG